MRGRRGKIIEGVGVVADVGLVLTQRVSFALGYWTTIRTAEDDNRVREIVRTRVVETARKVATQRAAPIEVYATKPGSEPWRVLTVEP